jgi:uncharacterized protein (TIGR02145 family)
VYINKKRGAFRGGFVFVFKAILTVVLGFSLSLANISGIVTDTSGTIPVSGALVQLEKGHQTATTGADGRFSLEVTVAIVSGHEDFQKSIWSATLRNGFLFVNMPHRSVIEVAAFDLNGRTLGKTRRTLDVGNNSIELPRIGGTGAYLYKVKSSDAEFVIKGYSSNNGQFGSVQLPGARNHMAKQATAPALDDVITVVKTGYLNYHVRAMVPETSGVEIRMIACDTTIKDADGNEYQAVKIGGQVWTVENLRATKYNDSTAILKDNLEINYSDTVPKPKYCYYDKMKDPDSIVKFGALYNGFAVSTGKLAPLGWHVPTKAEWDTLQNYLIAQGHNWDGSITENKIAKSLSAMTDWPLSTHKNCYGEINCDVAKNNKSGFSAVPAGYRDIFGYFQVIGYYGTWWTSTKGDTTYQWVRYLNYSKENLLSTLEVRDAFLSVRLVRD